MQNKIEQFLEDLSFNTKYKFLDMAQDKTEIEKVAKKSRIKIPCNDIAIFKAIYAYVDRQNLNGCTLKKAEVEKALDTLVGKAVDFDHFRKRVIGYFIDAFIEDDKIIAYGVFFKGNFAEDYKDVKELMEKDTLGISFEAWGTKEMKTANSYNLNDIEFAGGGLLMKESPAFPGAGVLEMSKERVLEFASVMTKPATFIHTEGESKVKEPEKSIDKNLIECSNCKEKFDWEALPECKMGFVKCPKCAWQVDQTGKAFDASNELPELARYYIWDMESIMKAMSSVECPSCKNKGMYDVQMIDFAGNKTKVKCACDAILNMDLTPAVKMEKKGRQVSKAEMDMPAVKAGAEETKKQEEVKTAEKNWLELFETSKDADDVLEEAFMNEVEYENVAELDGGKKLTYKERKSVDDKMFAVIKVVKNKVTGEPRKIRMFPIQDPAHVRNALARLGQKKVQDTLRSLGVSIDSVKQKILKRAKELNMKDLLDKYEKSTVEEQAKLFKETVEEVVKLKADIEISKTSIDAKDKEVATLKESVTAKDAELATLKTELETVKKAAEAATAEIAKRDKEIRDAEIAKRKTELGDLAKDMTDEDIMNEDKFKIAKLTKENADLKTKIPAEEPKKGSEEQKPEADLDKGSKDKKKDTEIFETQKRINEKAFGKEEKK